jgi:hypothetical protein
MPESPDAQIARLDERLSSIMTLMRESREEFKLHQDLVKEISTALTNMAHRVESVEHSLAKASPTIDEFITIKHKIQGAGVVGKWLWVALGFLVGTVYSMRETLIHWITK